MKSHIAYKFRIYPNSIQEELINKTFGCTRFIWNRMLDDYNHLHKINTPASYKKDFAFLKEVDSLALSNVQLQLSSAIKNEYVSKSGKPRFKSKKHSKRSYTTNCVNNNIQLLSHAIKLPKLGFVKCVVHREAPEDYKLKSVTVSCNSIKQYFVSILYEYDNQVQVCEDTKTIGLDYSMNHFYVDSHSHYEDMPHFFREQEERLVKEQRKLSRRYKKDANKQSARYYKQQYKVNKLHVKIANQRKDYLHKLSMRLINEYDMIKIEDLNMKGMSQALNFGKSVHDNGWGMFVRMLEYKAKSAGKRVEKVNKYYASSQICHVCGYRNRNTKDLSVREWKCPQCQTVHNRDVNAAINIRNYAIQRV